MNGTDASATPPGGRCAACGAVFHCGIADDRPCWCTLLEVDPARLAATAAPDAGCLCPACLARIGKPRSPAPLA